MGSSPPVLTRPELLLITHCSSAADAALIDPATIRAAGFARLVVVTYPIELFQPWLPALRDACAKAGIILNLGGHLGTGNPDGTLIPPWDWRAWEAQLKQLAAARSLGIDPSLYMVDSELWFGADPGSSLFSTLTRLQRVVSLRRTADFACRLLNDGTEPALYGWSNRPTGAADYAAWYGRYLDAARASQLTRAEYPFNNDLATDPAPAYLLPMWIHSKAWGGVTVQQFAAVAAGLERAAYYCPPIRIAAEALMEATTRTEPA